MAYRRFIPEDRIPELEWGTPESFGWVRRTAYDTKSGVCWEKPNGELYMAQRGVRFSVAKYSTFTFAGTA